MHIKSDYLAAVETVDFILFQFKTVPCLQYVNQQKSTV